jgi:hypothetical protein
VTGQSESWRGKTASLVLEALAEATRLLGRVPGLPFWPGGSSSPEEGGSGSHLWAEAHDGAPLVSAVSIDDYLEPT